MMIVTEIHRKPKRETHWLQECLTENGRTYGCYTLNQQWQDEHKASFQSFELNWKLLPSLILFCLLFV